MLEVIKRFFKKETKESGDNSGGVIMLRETFDEYEEAGVIVDGELDLEKERIYLGRAEQLEL